MGHRCIFIQAKTYRFLGYIASMSRISNSAQSGLGIREKILDLYQK